jgi:sirohydrochlorin ferrochelatase
VKALVIVAHGSRRAASNEEVIALSGQVAASLKEQYPIVSTGFLELASPLIPDAIEQCIQQGATDVTVLPYFLSAGRHVQEDVPAEVNTIQLKYPDTAITLLKHLGGMPQMVNLICHSLA